jgi:hypothetical protein
VTGQGGHETRSTQRAWMEMCIKVRKSESKALGAGGGGGQSTNNRNFRVTTHGPWPICQTPFQFSNFPPLLFTRRVSHALRWGDRHSTVNIPTDHFEYRLLPVTGAPAYRPPPGDIPVPKTKNSRRWFQPSTHRHIHSTRTPPPPTPTPRRWLWLSLFKFKQLTAGNGRGVRFPQVRSGMHMTKRASVLTAGGRPLPPFQRSSTHALAVARGRGGCDDEEGGPGGWGKVQRECTARGRGGKDEGGRAPETLGPKAAKGEVGAEGGRARSILLFLGG